MTAIRTSRPGAARFMAGARLSSPATRSLPGNPFSRHELNSTPQTISGALAGTPNAPWTASDATFMREARALARLGAGRTWTNPMVGAIVVANGEVVGRGYHHRAGEAHAETLALAAAGARARGATLYVSLEPCAHQGRTPPCVEAVLAAGITRVVIPAPDPDPRVCGRGAAWLRARGVRVDVGCDAASAVLDNHGYYSHRLGITPMVTIKMAASRDGMVARRSGQRDRVTGEAAEIDVHRLRAVHDAVVIGATTARIDRPRLDCRLLPDGVDREPVVVVFDTTLSLSAVSDWPASGREHVIVAGKDAVPDRAQVIESRGGRVLRCEMDGDTVAVRDALARLSAMGFTRLLVEGGPSLFESFVAAGAWDAMWHYESTAEFGPAGVPMIRDDARDLVQAALGAVVDETALGEDTRRRYLRPAARERLLKELMERSTAVIEENPRVHGNR